MKNLNGKTALITGASKGIGAEIAKCYANNGANVIINYKLDNINAKKLENDIIKNGGKAIAIQADITNNKAIDELLKQAHQKFGNIDILVNNAGIYKFEPFEMIDEKEYHRQFNSNVFSVLFTTQKALKFFNPSGGKIINISSIATQKATPMTVLYSATKGAVDAITSSLSKELASKKINVNAILPGPVETEGNPIIGTEMENYIKSNTSLGRIGMPKDIATVALFLASEDSNWITGQKIGVSGGF